MTPAFALLVTALVAGAAPAERAPVKDWRETAIVKDRDLVVRIKVLTRASLADTDWTALEFKNQGKRLLTVRDSYYWTRAEYFRLGTNDGVASGSLASGNTYDLFPDAWATTPVSRIILLPGKTSCVVQQPSDYSAALLGLAPPSGWSIRARVFLVVNLEDGRQLRPTEEAGVPFAFDWLSPDEAGFEAVRARLKRLLLAPLNRPQHAYILGLYLRIPEVARVATAEELVAAIGRRRHPFEGRADIVKYVAKRFANDPAVTGYYRQCVKEGDPVILDDLHHPTLWDRSYVEPLVRHYELNPAKFDHALSLLHKYRDDWIQDGKTVRGLADVVRRRFPAVQREVRRLEKEELEDWTRAMENLSMTGDQSAIALLSPALEDKRTFRATKFLSMPLDYRMPPLRVCDVALDAILTLLYGSPDAAYRRARRLPDRRGNLDAAYADLRDGMITELKGRLAARSKGN
jgi:hypothetical protein